MAFGRFSCRQCGADPLIAAFQLVARHIGTEGGLDGEILTAVAALINMSCWCPQAGQKRASAGIGRDIQHRLPPGIYSLTMRAARQSACKHGRHHQSHAHTDTGPSLSLRYSSLFHGHGRLHLHKLIHILDDIHTALVINRLLHLFRRGDGGDIELAELQTKMGEIGGQVSVCNAWTIHQIYRAD